jgi:hypothetical protein
MLLLRLSPQAGRGSESAVLQATKKRAFRPPLSIHPHLTPGRSEGSTRAKNKKQSYFFFAFLAFFAFFAFFAFLAIVSSQGLMVKRDTRVLGGGPASQHPRRQTQQIRGHLPRAVTPLSSRYPQLKRFFG